MSAYSSRSSSDYNTLTEAHSPLPVIRRPDDMLPLPRDSLSPNPDRSLESSSPIPSPVVATPVIITPTDRRSTRELVHIPRVVRRRVLAPRTNLNTIRRRLSMATTRELITERSARRTARNQKIDRTSTTIELCKKDGVDLLLLEALHCKAKSSVLPISQVQTYIPSEFSTRANIREQNRKQSLVAAKETFEKGSAACLSDILEALTLLEANMRLMATETEMIDQALEDYEQEKKEEHAKWANIQEIMKLIR